MADEKKETTEVVKAEPAPITGEKQGGKCCGCCCDYKRAVIVMAILGIVYMALLLILGVTGAVIGGVYAAQATDDELATGLTIASAGAGIISIGYAIGLGFYVFQLFAAIKYSSCMLITVLVFNVLGFGYSIWYQVALNEYNETYAPDQAGSANLAGAIIGVCIFFALEIYPTVGLLLEINKGIMSAETYPREAYSCCCEPKV